MVQAFKKIRDEIGQYELKKYNGIVKKVYKAPVTSSSYEYLWIETGSGHVIKTKISLGPGDLEYLQNLKNTDTVTIWVQEEWGLPPSVRVEYVWQFLHKDEYLTKYNKVRVERVSFFSKLAGLICINSFYFRSSIILSKHNSISLFI